MKKILILILLFSFSFCDFKIIHQRQFDQIAYEDKYIVKTFIIDKGFIQFLHEGKFYYLSGTIKIEELK